MKTAVDVLVVGALREEIRALVRRLDARRRLGPDLVAGRLRRRTVAVAATGDGAPAAREGMERILDAVSPTRIVLVGFAGGLAPALERGALLVARAVRNEDGRWEADAAWSDAVASALGAPAGLLASAKTLAADPRAKRALAGATGAWAVDLETAAWAAVAARVARPWIALRVVFDAWDEAVPRAVLEAADPTGRVDRRRLLASALLRPRRLPALVRAGRLAAAFSRRLADAVEVALDVPPA